MKKLKGILIAITMTLMGFFIATIEETEAKQKDENQYVKTGEVINLLKEIEVIVSEDVSSNSKLTGQVDFDKNI
ncbi:hypothetical protein ACOMCU_27565 [Lysinibacillus sp. UGB7]|uniref:hypothetical protein n=1 Tax=Lysinibacillus sp. UGB7 TaxID=3411039 RepID=UPI003B7917E3